MKDSFKEFLDSVKKEYAMVKEKASGLYYENSNSRKEEVKLKVVKQ